MRDDHKLITGDAPREYDFRRLADILNRIEDFATRLVAVGPIRISEINGPNPIKINVQPLVFPSYTVATVPAASSCTGGIIYVSDETGGAVPAFSDGTSWRRMTDRTVIS
jgi:hypothetical protein